MTAEDEHEESEMVEHAGDDTAFEVHDNQRDEDQLEEIDEDTLDKNRSDYMDVVSEDVGDPDEELASGSDVFCQQTRSFAVARDVVRRMRVSRGSYKISHPQAFEPCLSKGKGRGKKATTKMGNRKAKAKQRTTDRLSVKARARTVGVKLQLATVVFGKPHGRTAT